MRSCGCGVPASRGWRRTSVRPSCGCSCAATTARRRCCFGCGSDFGCWSCASCCASAGACCCRLGRGSGNGSARQTTMTSRNSGVAWSGFGARSRSRSRRSPSAAWRSGGAGWNACGARLRCSRCSCPSNGGCDGCSCCQLTNAPSCSSTTGCGDGGGGDGAGHGGRRDDWIGYASDASPRCAGAGSGRVGSGTSVGDEGWISSPRLHHRRLLPRCRCWAGGRALSPHAGQRPSMTSGEHEVPPLDVWYRCAPQRRQLYSPLLWNAENPPSADASSYSHLLS